MGWRRPNQSVLTWCIVSSLSLICWSFPAVGSARAEPEAPAAEGPPAPLTLDAAVWWALEHNPELAAIRVQHDIAAAAIVIAQTYPYNPVWEAKVRAANGPESAGITNRVSNEHKVFMDVELRGQGKYRRAGAAAAMSRTEWEIAFQELSVAIRVVRSFDTLLYRQEKLGLIERTIKLNEESAEDVKQMQKANKLRPADEIVARTEVDDARAQRAPGRLAVQIAMNDFRRNLGLVEEKADVQGALDAPLFAWDERQLVESALADRPDRRARELAVAEADARVKLARADRYGNINIGPAYEYDPTRINLIGVQFTRSLPVFNTHKGDILQREAERGRAAAELRQTEVQIQQDMQAALARLTNARDGLNVYDKEILPNLNKNFEAMKKLFAEADPGADLLRLIDIRRKMLKAQDGRLDALFEVRQAQADLAAAAGDPSVAVGPAKPGAIPKEGAKP
jgi:cobalt-zinc-cadmium efflux system outer membrane protein